MLPAGWAIYRPPAGHGQPYERRLSMVTRNGILCLPHSGTQGVMCNGSHCSLLRANETIYVA